MRDGNGGIVPPMAFIPAAERYDLMPEIDRWVVAHAFDTIAARRSGAKADAIALYAINLSGATIGDPSFLAFVVGEFERTGVPFESICFEVTETSAIASLGAASDFIMRMQNRGCCFALDDFGAGMASFGYLKQLPVDYLKIDGTFVRNMLTDAMDRLMVEAIHHIGHRMGKRTIAEFVENAAILEALERIGVDYAQGYGIGRPVPFDEALQPDRRVRNAPAAAAG
jgi:EAL domain-containing protein (putative c-di-GMP-specific phosphodiesterase class I)